MVLGEQAVNTSGHIVYGKVILVTTVTGRTGDFKGFSEKNEAQITNVSVIASVIPCSGEAPGLAKVAHCKPL